MTNIAYSGLRRRIGLKYKGNDIFGIIAAFSIYFFLFFETCKLFPYGGGYSFHFICYYFKDTSIHKNTIQLARPIVD